MGLRPWSAGITANSTGISIRYGRSWNQVPDVLTRERAEYLARRARQKRAVLFAQIALLALLLLLWEAAARCKWIDPFITSSPSRILATLQNLYASGDLFRHLGVSCVETVVGFILGTLAGTAIAVALWWFPALRRVLDPYLVVLGSLPKTALGPIFIVWIGAGPAAIIAMTLAISLIVTILEMLNGFCAVDAGQISLMKTLGAGRLQTLCKLVLPANAGTFVNALKVNVGLSWVGVIMGEFLVSRAGLGYLIVYGSQVFKMDLVMATVILLLIAAAAMYQGVLLLEGAMKKHWGVSA